MQSTDSRDKRRLELGVCTLVVFLFLQKKSKQDTEKDLLWYLWLTWTRSCRLALQIHMTLRWLGVKQASSTISSLEWLASPF